MAHKKKKKASFKAILKRRLLKYGCLILFLPAWLLAPSRYNPPITALLTLFCYAYIEIFNWLEDKKADNREKRIKLLARFWRYGYFPLALCAFLLCPFFQTRSFFFAAFFMYGAYTIIIALSMCRHFICGMQDASREPMNPRKRRIPAASYRRDGILMGLFFLILGLIGLWLS